MSTEEKLKKILDKEELEVLPSHLDFIKKYILSRYADEEDLHSSMLADIKKTIHAITNGDKK